MTFASRILEAVNQSLPLHRDAASEQRIRQLAASASMFTFYTEQGTAALRCDNVLLFSDFWISDDGDCVNIYVAYVPVSFIPLRCQGTFDMAVSPARRDFSLTAVTCGWSL